MYIYIYTHGVCSNIIRIGIVVVVHWVGCVWNQSWHIRTCLSNSWHKLQVAAFPQFPVVGRGSNTCVYVIAIFTMCESTEQRICIKFCFKSDPRSGRPFFDSEGIVHSEYPPDGQTSNKEFYVEVLRRLRESVRRNRPGKWRDGDWILHHDNAAAKHFTSCAAVFGQIRHRSVAAAAIFTRSRTVWFFLFPRLKN